MLLPSITGPEGHEGHLEQGLATIEEWASRRPGCSALGAGP